MNKIEWPIKNQNAKYKYGENPSKETSINISKEIFDFLGGKNNGDVINVILRKKDFLLAFSKISSCLPLFYFHNGSQEAKFDSKFFDANYQEIEEHFGNSEEISYKIKLTINDRTTVRYYMYRMDGAKNFIIRDFLIGENSFINFIKNDDGQIVIQPIVLFIKEDNSLNFSSEHSLENEEIKENDSLNRIIFGAPGTGKSYKLKEQAIDFEDKTDTNPSEDDLLKQEIIDAGTDKNKLFAIGMKYSEQLKDKDIAFIKDTYNLKYNYAYTLYQALRVASEQLDDFGDDITDDNITTQIEKYRNTQFMKQAGVALVGYKYSYYLDGRTKKDLADVFNLTGSLASWISCGIKAANYQYEKTETRKSKRYERVTFHPNYTFAQFVGTYKPVKSEDDLDEITYEYVPGPFMRVYVAAKNNPEKNYLLLIEEINRANVAAVFGDVFQLLDRNDDGESQYPIIASEDQKRYLEANDIYEDEIAIPDNMYIWATMNSADQGVLPMDAAFKRRWDFEYLDIDENEDKVARYDIPINFDGTKTVKWNELRKAINDKLTDLGINEDKLLGPFFMSEKSLKEAMFNKEKFVKLFESKVIMYLFEDVVKMKQSSFFNAPKLRYSLICNEFEEKGLSVFKLLNEVHVHEPENSAAETDPEQS